MHRMWAALKAIPTRIPTSTPTAAEEVEQEELVQQAELQVAPFSAVLVQRLVFPSMCMDRDRVTLLDMAIIHRPNMRIRILWITTRQPRTRVPATATCPPKHCWPKSFLIPLASAAVLGIAAALVSNPLLLQLGTVSGLGTIVGKRKRRAAGRNPLARKAHKYTL